MISRDCSRQKSCGGRHQAHSRQISFIFKLCKSFEAISIPQVFSFKRPCHSNHFFCVFSLHISCILNCDDIPSKTATRLWVFFSTRPTFSQYSCVLCRKQSRVSGRVKGAFLSAVHMAMIVEGHPQRNSFHWGNLRES